MAPFPAFIGPTYPAQSVLASAQRAVNFYVEVPQVEGEAQAVYYGVPGLTSITASFGGEVGHRAAFSQDGRQFVIVGTKFAELSSAGAVTIWGTVANDGSPATMHSNGQAGHQLFIVSGKQGYLFDLTANTFTVITTGGFPNGRAIMGAFFEGYFVVVTSDSIQISKSFDGTSWNAGDKATRQLSTDNLAGIIASGRILWLLGSKRTEGWYNSGTTFPLAPVSGAIFDYGLAGSGFTLANFDNSVAWLAQNGDGDRMVMTATQGGAQRISTHALEEALRGCPTLTDCRAYAYQEAGHSFYVLTSPANNLTWALDAAVPAPYGWCERGSWNTTSGIFEAQRAITHMVVNGQHWVGDRSTSTLYRQALGLYDDNGNPIRHLRRSPHVTTENRRVFYGLFELLCETGVGLSTGQGSDPLLMLRYSDDGGHVWSNEMPASLGKIGTYLTRARWTRLGVGRNRVFEVSQSDPVKTCWTGAVLEAQPGLH